MGQLHRFVFEGAPVRGSLVRLGAAWREMLSRRGHDVRWMDGVAEEWSYAEFRSQVEREQPDFRD